MTVRRVLPGPRPHVQVRPITRRDLHALVALNAQADATEHALIPDVAAARIDSRRARQYWKRQVDAAHTRVLVATLRSRVLGLIAVDLIVRRSRHAIDKRLVYLHSLFVLPGLRRMRLGSRLTASALAWGRRRGATQARLEVADNNTGALALYHRAGFRERERMLVRPL